MTDYNEEEDGFFSEGARAERQRQRELERSVARGKSLSNRHQPADLNTDAVLHGVTVNWLATVLGMHTNTVKARLKDCPPAHRVKGGFIYDVKMAMRYLVKPVVDIDAYIKTMKIEELPPRLQTEYWGAKQRRLKFEEDAGHLWRTEAVMALVGTVVSTVRTKSRLWTEELELVAEITPEQRKVLNDRVDKLQAGLFEAMREMTLSKQTKSVLMEYLEEEARELALEEEMRQRVEEDGDDDGFDITDLV